MRGIFCELNIEEEAEFNNHLAELKKRFPDIDNNKETNKRSKKNRKSRYHMQMKLMGMIMV